MIWDIYLLEIFGNLSPAALNNTVTLVCFRGSSLPQLCLCRILLLGLICWGQLHGARNWCGWKNVHSPVADSGSCRGCSLGLCWLRTHMPGAAAKGGQGKSGLVQHQIYWPHLLQLHASNHALHSSLHPLSPALFLPFILWLWPLITEAGEFSLAHTAGNPSAGTDAVLTVPALSPTNLMLTFFIASWSTEPQGLALGAEKTLQKRLQTQWAGSTIPQGMPAWPEGAAHWAGQGQVQGQVG